MILLKDLLLEMSSLNLLIARRTEGRMEKYIQLKIKQYIKDKNVGDFNISGLKLTTLPSSLKNLKIGGNFYCNHNKLTSLVGAPVSVGGYFYCHRNKLTSLVGAPTSVDLDFLCSDNKLTSLVGAPTSVGLSFHCDYNNLTSLVGAPTSVGGSFNCSNNVVKFTEEQVRAVCDVKGNINV